MSLVEKALRKLQEGKAAESGARPVPPAINPPAEVVVGSLVHAPLETEDAPAEPLKHVRIDRQALRTAGLLPPEYQERELAEQYRQIKRPLISNAMGRGMPKVPNGHLIMVASATPGEGKTFTSINLALSMALEKDIRVLLIDADVAKPHISRLFGVDEEPGLLDALRDRSLDVETLVIGTDVPGLSILPAGRQTEMATELIASARMEEVVNRIGARDASRIALFDSPPLLLTSESRVLVSVVGQVALVVAAGRVAQEQVMEAISHLGEGKLIGLVLNQSTLKSAGNYYYGYGTYPVPDSRLG